MPIDFARDPIPPWAELEGARIAARLDRLGYTVHALTFAEPAGVAALLGVDLGTLSRWHSDGNGPPAVTTGARRRLYDVGRLAWWLGRDRETADPGNSPHLPAFAQISPVAPAPEREDSDRQTNARRRCR